jgi:hypothetical protein
MQSTPSSSPPVGSLQLDIYAALIVTLTLAVVAISLHFLA